ncbi:cytochrome-c peroxidase [Porphyromonadaceae bacterium]
MNKTLLGVGAIALVAVVAQYLKMDKSPDSSLTPDQQVATIFETGHCLACHSQNPELPFYADFPIAGDQVRRDIELGVKAIDLTDMYNALKSGGPINEVAVAKVEYAIREGSMPPLKYSVVHWGSQINSTEKEIVLNWVADYRKAHFSLGTNAEAFINEPVQAIPETVEVDEAKAALGFKLYHDTRLSADNTISCASCHGLNTGGVDNEQFSDGVGGQKGNVNAPTVFNAGHNFVQFWDGRAVDLQQQAAGPPLNPVEMASTSWEQIAGKLIEDKELTKEFLAIYPDGYSEKTITDAIQEFEKTLITPNSRFDRYLKGQPDALTAEEIKGYELFKQHECATCHAGVIMGGQSYELMGLHGDYFGIRGIEITDGDKGRNMQTNKDYDMHRFKVPTLRNIALTWPYFHDGTKQTLEEATEAMMTFQIDKKYKKEDVASIVGFLKTLTGEYNGKLLTNDNDKN